MNTPLMTLVLLFVFAVASLNSHAEVIQDYQGFPYKGEMRDGHPEGYGEISNADGFVYRGAFKAGKMHGKGVAYYSDGSRYDGLWLDNKRSGKGIYYYANGNRYDGKWRFNQRHGFGVFYKTGGATESGRWDNGKLVSALKTKASFVEQDQVLQWRVMAWKRAWESGDSDAYLAFYSTQFRPSNDVPLDRWKKQRKQRVKPTKEVSIAIQNQSTSFSDDNNTALISFLQAYRSNTFNSIIKKEMLWRKERTLSNSQEMQWMIVLEAKR